MFLFPVSYLIKHILHDFIMSKYFQSGKKKKQLMWLPHWMMFLRDLNTLAMRWRGTLQILHNHLFFLLLHIDISQSHLSIKFIKSSFCNTALVHWWYLLLIGDTDTDLLTSWRMFFILASYCKEVLVWFFSVFFFFNKLLIQTCISLFYILYFSL